MAQLEQPYRPLYGPAKLLGLVMKISKVVGTFGIV